jgi:hypothetical protein
LGSQPVLGTPETFIEYCSTISKFQKIVRKQRIVARQDYLCFLSSSKQPKEDELDDIREKIA